MEAPASHLPVDELQHPSGHGGSLLPPPETLEAELTRPGPVDPYRPPQDLGDTPLATRQDYRPQSKEFDGISMHDSPREEGPVPRQGHTPRLCHPQS